MHLSYYFLRFLSEELRARLLGFQLAECYLQNRYECVMGFHNGKEEFFIKLNLYPEFTCLSFPPEFHKNKRGAYHVFHELNGLRLQEVVQHENDRSFHLVFENDFSLMFKLYGSRSNLILLYQNNCIDLLNKNLLPDREIVLDRTAKSSEVDFDKFAESGGDLRKLFPALDKELIIRLEKEGYKEKDLPGRWTLITELQEALSRKQFFLQETEEGIKLSFFPEGKQLHSTSSALEAAHYFERYAAHLFYFKKEKQDTIHNLQQKIKKASAYLQILEDKQQEIAKQVKYDEIANIIMANLHQIPKHSEQVELFNFYTEKNIQIKLKRELSPQKNAENYYRKAKNQKLEIAQLEKNAEAKRKGKELLELQLAFVQEIEDLKSLRKYLKEQDLAPVKPSKEKEQENLFRRFEIEGFEILVGKNARNNDLLTQKHSFKEDLWLHARDVTGSHVLIKYKAGKKFPKSLIEKAAQLAAFYSKRKTDSLCPVIVTPKKYVRKPKGALEGQVVVEREEVLLVKPAGYDEL